MKNILVACIVCFFFIPDLLAQTVDNNNSYTVNAYDINGKVLTNKTTDVLGTPLLNDEWGKGKVKFKTGQFITNLELQYNLAENELYFKKDNITYAFVDPIEEFELSYQFENEKRFSTFRCGYPLSGENTRTTFYEVIIDGKNLQLLRKTFFVRQNIVCLICLSSKNDSVNQLVTET